MRERETKGSTADGRFCCRCHQVASGILGIRALVGGSSDGGVEGCDDFINACFIVHTVSIRVVGKVGGIGIFIDGCATAPTRTVVSERHILATGNYAAVPHGEHAYLVAFHEGGGVTAFRSAGLRGTGVRSAVRGGEAVGTGCHGERGAIGGGGYRFVVVAATAQRNSGQQDE